jgi:hypothetical protein
MLSAAGGEVIDAQHLRNGPGRTGHGHDRPKQCRAAHRCVQDGGKTAPGPAGQRDGDSLQNSPGGRRAAAIANGQPFDLLGERTPRTTNVLAVQPPHRQLDQYRPISNRRVSKASSIRAVHPVGRHCASGAGHLSLPSARHQANDSAVEEHTLPV